MYYLSPFTYLIDGMLATGLANNKVTCSSIEINKFSPPSNETCGEFMNDFKNIYGGYLLNPNARRDCEFCSANETNTVLGTLNSHYSHRWRNFGIMWAFIIFNIATALFLYWLARVPKKQKVLDSAPTDLASRVQTRVSENAAAVAEKSKGEDHIPRKHQTSNKGEEIAPVDGRSSEDFVTPFEGKNELFQSIVKGGDK